MTYTLTRKKLKYDYRIIFEKEAAALETKIETPLPHAKEVKEAEFVIPKEEPSVSAEKSERSKKHRFELFETDNTAEINRKISELINSDGYYDEIRPADDGVTVSTEKKKKNGKGLLIAASIIVFIAASIIIFINLRTLFS